MIEGMVEMPFGLSRDKAQGEISYLKEVARNFAEDQLPIAAAGIAFYLLLSLVPLLLLVVSIAAFFVSQAQIQTAMSALAASFGPTTGSALQNQLMSLVSNRGVLTGLALIGALWAGSQVFVVMETALNNIWQVEERRPFWASRGLALVMVVIAGVLTILAVALAFAVQILARFDFNIPVIGIALPPVLFTIVSLLLLVLVITGTFLLLYWLLPVKKTSLWHMFPGALTAAVLYVAAMQGFSWYATNIADYSVLYGSIGGVVLLLLWFYYSAFIMLFGAEMAAVKYRRAHREKKEERAEKRKAA
jgi:membrane protein